MFVSLFSEISNKSKPETYWYRAVSQSIQTRFVRRQNDVFDWWSTWQPDIIKCRVTNAVQQYLQHDN